MQQINIKKSHGNSDVRIRFRKPIHNRRDYQWLAPIITQRTDKIGCHQSTISREIRRGSVTQRRSDLTEHTVYFPDTGQAVYEKNRSRSGAKYKLAEASEFIQLAVEKMQKEQWSPDAICGFVKAQKQFENATVCTKTLYRYIDPGLLPVKNIPSTTGDSEGFSA